MSKQKRNSPLSIESSVMLSYQASWRNSSSFSITSPSINTVNQRPLRNPTNRFHIEACKVSNVKQLSTLAVFCLCIKVVILSFRFQSEWTLFHLTHLESTQYSSTLKNHLILFKKTLGISEFQSTGLLEAGFAIWAVDDFIRRHTGSDESHRVL